MSNLSYLLLPLTMVIAIIVIMVFYLASLESRTFDWSWMEDPWYTGVPGLNRWTVFPYRIRNEIRRGSEGFKRTLDPMPAGLEKGVSPEEYAEHHRRKERDMR